MPAAGGGVRLATQPHCTHELFRPDGCGVHLDAERGQGVADGIGDGRRRSDRTAFAHTFDTEGIERRG
jgi:hypothetical protein